jgi:Kef-type K+ transport system membrane component KefB
LRFLASIGAVLLTFLAGAELEPEVIRTKWKKVTVVGLIGFAAPFIGCAALARYALGWSPSASLLTGLAFSTTSMAVVYATCLKPASTVPNSAKAS